MALEAAAHCSLEDEKSNNNNIFVFIILKPLCRSILIALLAPATARTADTSISALRSISARRADSGHGHQQPLPALGSHPPGEVGAPGLIFL